ncbi:poly polymerase and DNA-ligase Zn-finger region-domain-containing protein [Syncephalastrum racemosum]|uniref:Poly polymerase and DNA-ligase Zn-finger region-domain-containing protein n=1 Tax=Syncephalastrum racemosum TaxID=13706 RepID=A0A1X2HVN0_SYNRA|nr:poly polymerase and DNA-ligase Zn-finger region-domain-containing protein [Syncephalastrum racemosum]
MGYHLEYAKSNRSKCTGPKTTCVSVENNRTIEKGDLRVGVDFERGGREGTVWKHWLCVTSKVIENMKETVESPEDIDGFDTLKDADQDKIREAWESGDVGNPIMAAKAKEKGCGS